MDSSIPDLANSPIVTPLYCVGAVILIYLLFKSGPPEGGNGS